jgi:hypothetical protein
VVDRRDRSRGPDHLAHRPGGIVGVLYAVGTLALGLLLLVAAGEARRRARTQKAPPRIRDADDFLAALKACRAKLSPNPRGVVRFTNLCRFLYPVVARSPQAAGTWQEEFFDGLRRRWSGEGSGGIAGWLAAELDRWIPDAGQSEVLNLEQTSDAVQQLTPLPPPTTPLPPQTPAPDSDPSSFDPPAFRNGDDERDRPS